MSCLYGWLLVEKGVEKRSQRELQILNTVTEQCQIVTTPGKALMAHNRAFYFSVNTALANDLSLIKSEYHLLTSF